MHAYNVDALGSRGKAPSSNIDDTALCKVVSSPSKVIKHFRTTISHDEAPYELILITMRRSFLLVINNKGSLHQSNYQPDDEDNNLTNNEILEGFMSKNPLLKGLSMAIGEHSTCLINSDNSVASATLASRLSKKLNFNRPVYVANNISLPHDTLDTSSSMSGIYLKVFQFVRSHYNCNNDGPSSI